jgi:hypothetical protein
LCLLLYDAYMQHLHRLRIPIDPKAVCQLRFILQGYDNLFDLRTLDARLGILELIAASGAGQEALEILEDLAEEIGLDSLEPPRRVQATKLAGDNDR